MNYARSLKNSIYSGLVQMKKIGKTNNRSNDQKFLDNVSNLSICLKSNLDKLHQLFGMRLVKNSSFLGFFQNTSNSLMIKGKFNYKKSQILQNILQNYKNIYNLINELLNIIKNLKINLFHSGETNLLQKEPLNNSFNITNNIDLYKKNAFPVYKKILLNLQECLSKYKLNIPITSNKNLASLYYIDLEKIDNLMNLIVNELEILKTYNNSIFGKISKIPILSFSSKSGGKKIIKKSIKIIKK
jgi:hypothetical protein